MGLALKICDLGDGELLDEKTLPTKVCSGCDPDVPGHAERRKCLTCNGTGRETLGFKATLMEIVGSRAEESRPQGRRGGGGDLDYDDDVDMDGDGDLDY